MFASYMSEDVVTAEDAFNKALAECNTEQERQQLITETLTSLYGDAADTYNDVSGSMGEAKEAVAENIIAENNLANAIEPVTTAWQKLKTQGLEAILPIVQYLSDFLMENKWILEAVTVVLGILAAAIAALVVAGMYLLMQFMLWAVVIVAAITLVVVFWEEIKAFFIMIGDWLYENVIVPIVEFFKGLWETISNGVITLWETIKNAFKTGWEWIINTPVFEFFSELFKSIWATIESTIAVIVDLFFGAWELIKAVWGVAAGWFNMNIVQPVSVFFKGLWGGVSEAASNAWGKLKSGAQNAWQGIKSVFSSVASFFGDIFGKAWEKVKAVFSVGGKIFSGITEGITSAFKKVVNAIISGINKVVSVPFNAINKVLDKIRGVSIAGISPFSNLGSISVPKIPLLAEGGILTQPTLNIAGEAGPEAIIPIDKLQTYISGAIEKTMQVVNLQALVYAIEDLANRTIELNINGQKFATATAGDTDTVNGNRVALSKRGLAL